MQQSSQNNGLASPVLEDTHVTRLFCPELGKMTAGDVTRYAGQSRHVSTIWSRVMSIQRILLSNISATAVGPSARPKPHHIAA
ncbi:hypothetical protein PoB_004474400 [Plakobranchus ocellatus]|uniref:Uncharacterized protein n=1 Tax=Plakobranchus ocellatus TaxID=259542 RepID=A0AAV4BIW0_9GAST|nr:hypothetical protein PoB_004474400 [Plakobranchus ocellatus]